MTVEEIVQLLKAYDACGGTTWNGTRWQYPQGWRQKKAEIQQQFSTVGLELIESDEGVGLFLPKEKA